MSEDIKQAIDREAREGVTRRHVLLSLPALAMAARAAAQGTAPIRTVAMNNVVIGVSDLNKSVEVYERLFGTSMRQGDLAVFRLAKAPLFFGLRQVTGAETPGYVSWGMTIENFDADRIVKDLAALGVKGASVTMRDGTPEVWVPDPDGAIIQLQHASYGHGSGKYGEVIPKPKSSAKPVFQLQTINHVTLTVKNGKNTRTFFDTVFGLPLQTTQDQMLLLQVGRGPELVGFSSTANNPNVRPGPNHACFTIENFDANRVIGALAKAGFQPVEWGNNALVKPMTCRARLRQYPNNGGGPTYPLGTYELYFQDPDNIIVKIQDVRYCGGRGQFGEICP